MCLVGAVVQVINEVQLLKKMHHPFVVDLMATAQDTRCIYLVMELLQGGVTLSPNSVALLCDLVCVIGGFFNYLIKRNTLVEAEAQFYIANVLLALQHLHEREIVFRDLKPENLVFESGGHVKLVDFGFARLLRNNALTHTICGTIEYIAPEVLAQNGYGRSADLWSVGILLYEMVTGVTPYCSGAGSLEEMQEQIKIGDRRIPSGVSISAEAEDFIDSLLIVNPIQRVGCVDNGYSDIREHAWFCQPGGKFDWNKLERMELTPPYVPTCLPLQKSKIDYQTLHEQHLQFDDCPMWCPDLDLEQSDDDT